jgi:hypothetical protein
VESHQTFVKQIQFLINRESPLTTQESQYQGAEVEWHRFNSASIR